MEEKPLDIPIDKIKADFQSFLAPEHNRRIIFSGPFGIGKTYFLNEFFKEKEDEYFSIFLRPVNYSLLSNEDIFKLLKYDILVQIIKDENFKFEEEFDFTKTEYLKYFLKENRFLILKNLLKALPKIRNVVSAAEELEKLYSKYKEGLDKINSSKELEMLKTFQQDSESSFLLEYDEVSEYISSKLDELANSKIEGKSKLQKVLIIDDLDRLDPEHIFRLFNIFSAHFDQVHYYENQKGNDNKFGFDKIIFVCDIENIRKIFAHKYGSEVDFSGYIDKFYSTEIFNFLHDDVFEGSILPYLEKKLLSINPTTHDLIFVDAIKLIIQILFLSRQLNIREIIRLKNLKSIVNDSNKYRRLIIPLSKVGARSDSSIIHYNFLLLTKLLIDLIGDKKNFYERLKRVASNLTYEKYFNSNNYYNFICELIMFAKMDSHKFSKIRIKHSIEKKDAEEYIFSVNISGIDVEIKCEITAGYENRYDGPMWYYLNLDKTPTLSIIQFFKLYFEASQKIFDETLL